MGLGELILVLAVLAALGFLGAAGMRRFRTVRRPRATPLPSVEQQLAEHELRIAALERRLGARSGADGEVAPRREPGGAGGLEL